MSWSLWKSLFSVSQKPHSVATARRTRLTLEMLEDRWVPSATPTVDLTTAGAFGEVNGALFSQFSPQPTGTGYIDSFVRLQAKGAGTQAQQGYNTDARPLQFDENSSPQFTRSLLLSNVPLVDVGGVACREFLLDINQKASQPLLSLDQLRIYCGGAGNLGSYTNGQLAGLNAVYDLDAGGDHWVKLNSRLSTGSGSGDMLLYVPDSLFTGGPYVYLYSSFGQNYMANAGFEEWSVGRGGVSIADQNGGTGAIFGGSGAISGTVYFNGAPIVDAVVFLDANNNGILDANEAYTVTDSSGNYQFDGLLTSLGSFSTYDVAIQVPGGDTTSQSYLLVSLTSDGQHVYNVNFFLTDAGIGGIGE